MVRTSSLTSPRRVTTPRTIFAGSVEDNMGIGTMVMENTIDIENSSGLNAVETMDVTSVIK